MSAATAAVPGPTREGGVQVRLRGALSAAGCGAAAPAPQAHCCWDGAAAGATIAPSATSSGVIVGWGPLLGAQHAIYIYRY